MTATHTRLNEDHHANDPSGGAACTTWLGVGATGSLAEER